MLQATVVELLTGKHPALILFMAFPFCAAGSFNKSVRHATVPDSAAGITGNKM